MVRLAPAPSTCCLRKSTPCRNRSMSVERKYWASCMTTSRWWRPYATEKTQRRQLGSDPEGPTPAFQMLGAELNFKRTMRVDRVARFNRHAAGRVRKIFAILWFGVNDGARGADHHAHAASRLARAYRGGNVATLGADAGPQQWHVADDGAHLRQFFRESRAHHQSALAALVPLARHQARHALVQWFAIGLQELQVRAAWIGGAAQDDHATVGPGQVRVERIFTHVGVDGDSVGAITLERFARVLRGGGADIAALGVEDQRNMRVVFTHVTADVFQLLFCAQRAEIGDLRLECAYQVGRSVDDAGAKGGDSIGRIAQLRWQLGQIRVQAHAQQGIIGRPRGG